ncbi:MAG: hypothetical protein OFPII_42090 [Osedax symbiont Rs1]|nr:MAG: hypothetical protein OFPII_42090 [Osedax symbiont Rs1]
MIQSFNTGKEVLSISIFSDGYARHNRLLSYAIKHLFKVDPKFSL